MEIQAVDTLLKFNIDRSKLPAEGVSQLRHKHFANYGVHSSVRVKDAIDVGRRKIGTRRFSGHLT